MLRGLCNPFSLFFPFYPFSLFPAARRVDFFLRFSRVRPGELLPFWEQSYRTRADEDARLG
ncbi:MAG: hypothetical protein DWQ53_06915 [Microcystis flos-aquae DF17]|nr:MAG: hypothetical protein DWQ53_06915 [Microcystis flos-aquae DF17]